jgi:hypothetical protein
MRGPGRIKWPALSALLWLRARPAAHRVDPAIIGSVNRSVQLLSARFADRVAEDGHCAVLLACHAGGSAGEKAALRARAKHVSVVGSE